MEIDDEGNPVQEKLDSVEEQEVETLEEAEISFNAILGRPTTTTMKLLGSISSKEVLLLVDSGSTHNFISDSVVRDLNLPTLSIPTFGVQIGDGSVVRCNQICKGIEVMISGLKITQDFYPFSLVGSDLVLGIKWLASLNTIQANWNELFLAFWVDGKQYKLQGVPRLERQQPSLHSMHSLELKLRSGHSGSLKLDDLMTEPVEEASWEDYDLLLQQFPEFRLEDKSVFQGESIDTNPKPIRTYQRRKRRA
ncbi:unnamed protein product [Cuscuta campestris]|uniref:Uncharacterized protein n=1 Tax=Cuscuta campestris TaxID=132261 RepID=A0A484KUU2_9ASTE|nr:unnamed protein product [Cuscuta campestris]